MPCSLLVASGTWKISKDGALAQGDPTRTLLEGGWVDGWMRPWFWGGSFNSENTGRFFTAVEWLGWGLQVRHGKKSSEASDWSDLERLISTSQGSSR